MNNKVKLTATGSEFYVLFLKNIVLTLFTLGIYRFWAKTETRKYLWSHTELWGDRFEWTGNGMELLVGFFKAILFMIVAIGIPFGLVALTQNQTLGVLLLIVGYPCFFALAFYAGYSARRYRLSRTVWRGIRGGLAGSGKDFAILGLKNFLMMIITLGFYSPYMTMNLTKFVTDNSEFGNQRMSFDGKGSDLIGLYVKCILLAPFTLGFSVIYYQGEISRYVFEHTRFGEVSFKLNATGFDFIGLMLTNMLIAMFTLGLGLPYVILRSLRWVFERLDVVGQPDFQKLGQNTQTKPKTGEGLLDLLDGEIAS